LKNQLAQELQLREAAEKEVGRLREGHCKQDKATMTEKSCTSNKSSDTEKETELLKTEVERAWKVASMMEENLCKKETELDAKEEEIKELQEKLMFAVSQCTAAQCRIGITDERLINIPIPEVELASLPTTINSTNPIKTERPLQNTAKRNVEHSTPLPRKKLKILSYAKKGKTKHSNTLEKIKVEDSKQVMNAKALYPPLVSSQRDPNVQTAEKGIRSQMSEIKNLSTLPQSLMIVNDIPEGLLENKTTAEKRAFLWRSKGSPARHMFIYCVHCHKIRRQLPRKDRSGYRFRHSCPVAQTNRVTQNLTHKLRSCQLSHEGPCCRLATDEEIANYKDRF